MSTRNLTAVEGLRFFLFLGIFVFHCVSRWFPIGWGGVEAFLVIGSFFLTSKYLKREQHELNVGDVFLHRIKRLYPVYLPLVLVFSLVLIVYKRSISLEPLWYIFSLQNFRVLFENATYSLDGFIGHFWYIGLDVWLFLLWVFIMRLVPRRHLRTAFILSVLVGIAWRTTCILTGKYEASYMIPVGQMDCWALGGLAALSIKENGKNDKLMWLEIILGVCGVIALTLYNTQIFNCTVGESYQLWHSSEGYTRNVLTGNIHLIIAVLSVGLLRYCVDTTRKHPVLSAAPLVALGGMSYELYCFHYPIKVVVKHFVHSDIFLVILALIVTYIVSLLWCRMVMPIVNKMIK